jgi:hypothetical protein
LTIQAIVSYRSIPRILELFNSRTPLELGWIPHFTSVINWSLRLGLGLLNQITLISEPWLAIIDHSIDVGTKKVLVVLRVKRDALARRKGAIRLEDCECIGMKVCEKVKGDTLALDLERIFNQAGSPLAVIKDNDYTLQKGVRLWSEKQDTMVHVIEDIGHVVATALKKQFGESKGYKRLTTATSKGAKRLRQTELAFLVPPKLRTKGRFQSISKLGKWADKMIVVLGVKGRAKKGSLLAKLRLALPNFSRLKPFIKRFALTTACVSQVMKILKKEGLDQKHYEQCCSLVQNLPKYSLVKKRLLIWLEQHLAIQQKITSMPLLVSRDIIESLLGHFKHILERSPQADMNRTTLLIPALCGKLNDRELTQILNQTPHSDLKKWENENIPYTMRRKRQAFFNQNESQIAGSMTLE